MKTQWSIFRLFVALIMCVGAAFPSPTFFGLNYTASGGSFTPTDIAGLQLWLSADTLVLSDGDPVSSWVDASGQGHDAHQTGSVRPVYKTNIVNGKPVLRFTGLAGSSNYIIDDGYSYVVQTMFIVYKQTTATANFDGMMTCRVSPNSSLVSASDVNFGFTSKNLGDAIVSVGSADAAVYVDGVSLSVSDFDNFLVGVTSTTGSWHVIVVQLTSASGSGAKNFCIGIDVFMANRGLVGDIAEVGLYDSALSTGNRQSLETYLGTKYGITVTP